MMVAVSPEQRVRMGAIGCERQKVVTVVTSPTLDEVGPAGPAHGTTTDDVGIHPRRLECFGVVIAADGPRRSACCPSIADVDLRR